MVYFKCAGFLHVCWISKIFGLHKASSVLDCRCAGFPYVSKLRAGFHQVPWISTCVLYCGCAGVLQVCWITNISVNLYWSKLYTGRRIRVSNLIRRWIVLLSNQPLGVSGGLEVVSSQHKHHLPYSSFRASIRQDIKNAEWDAQKILHWLNTPYCFLFR